VLGDGGGDHRAPYDWRVVTAEGVLELLLDEELDPSLVELDPLAAEEVELSSSDSVFSPDVVVSSDELVGFSDGVVGFSDLLVVFPDDDADAAVCVPLEADVVVPIEPSNATAPNASANVASDTATTRLRIWAMRAARARSLAWASSFGDG
jgi:hypothetical protein